MRDGNRVSTLVKVTKEKNIGWIYLNNPEKLNTIGFEMLDQLEKAVDDLASDEEIRCILIRGTGERAFSAGADVSQMATFTPSEGEAFSHKGQTVLQKIRANPKPVIAVINGYAMGGGCELALACDLRIASDKVRLSQSEVNLGLIPGWGGTQELSRTIGLARAKELAMTGRAVDASEALAIGLVNKLVPHDQLDQEARKIAEGLTVGPSKALAEVKSLINLSVTSPTVEGYRKEREGFVKMFSTEDLKEGFQAFKEKRKPVFKGK